MSELTPEEHAKILNEILAEHRRKMETDEEYRKEYEEMERNLRGLYMDNES